MIATDILYARLSAAAYTPKGDRVTRISFNDISTDITGNIVAIRGTTSYSTLMRDMTIQGEVCVTHPKLGECQLGALGAAVGLLPFIPATVDTFTGHSEGGTIAVILAALHGAKTIVTWDAPKAGGNALAAYLAAVEIRQYRFNGSLVSSWPFGLDHHVREPLVEIGDFTLDPIRAHSIDRAVAWLAARVAVAA